MWRPAKRELAMVFQTYALYPHLTVRDNMGLALKQAGQPKRQIEELRLDKAAAMLALGPLMDRRPGGTLGRTAPACRHRPGHRADAEAFPLSTSLSPISTPPCVSTRGSRSPSLHRDLKATMIYVTHDQVEAMTLADRIVVIARGQGGAGRQPDGALQQPGNTFVAGFIGSPADELP
jgi:multiple sugar transport system ATP-binding protein